jgi:hypothetical protein
VYNWEGIQGSVSFIKEVGILIKRYKELRNERECLFERWFEIAEKCRHYNRNEIRTCKNSENLEPGFADNCTPDLCPLL